MADFVGAIPFDESSIAPAACPRPFSCAARLPASSAWLPAYAAYRSECLLGAYRSDRPVCLGHLCWISWFDFYSHPACAFCDFVRRSRHQGYQQESSQTGISSRLVWYSLRQFLPARPVDYGDLRYGEKLSACDRVAGYGHGLFVGPRDCCFLVIACLLNASFWLRRRPMLMLWPN